MALNHSPQQVWLISSFLTWMPTIAREKCKAYYNQKSKFVVKKKKTLIMENPAKTMLKIFNFENYNIAEVGKYALIFHIISVYHHD